MKPVSGDKFNVVGVMSGTSLDGLDIVFVEFISENNKWDFNIISAETFDYSDNWIKKLKNASTISGEELLALNSEYGRFIGKQINDFLIRISFSPDIIASHGHTVFHQPEKGITLQIGNGAEIFAQTNIKTVCDFRVQDVALGGQGAPLVPIGDKLLFSDFEYCLNLGGFSNVSFQQNNKRIAFDICPVNLILNYFAEKQSQPFDKNGKLGKTGKINQSLLHALNNLAFYKQLPPRSLGREWVDSTFLPALNSFSISDSDKLRTVYEHIAIQISKIGSSGKLLITGGGAFNTFLIERIQYHSRLQIVIPNSIIVNFKEALIFGLLGVLKIQNKINCLSSVTGAKTDSCVGTVFGI